MTKEELNEALYRISLYAYSPSYSGSRLDWIKDELERVGIPPIEAMCDLTAGTKNNNTEEDRCEVCGELFEDSTVPDLARDETCGDCIELAADYLFDSMKDAYYDD